MSICVAAEMVDGVFPLKAVMIVDVQLYLLSTIAICDKLWDEPNCAGL